MAFREDLTRYWAGVEQVPNHQPDYMVWLFEESEIDNPVILNASKRQKFLASAMPAMMAAISFS